MTSHTVFELEPEVLLQYVRFPFYLSCLIMKVTLTNMHMTCTSFSYFALHLLYDSESTAGPGRSMGDASGRLYRALSCKNVGKYSELYICALAQFKHGTMTCLSFGAHSCNKKMKIHI